MRMLAPVLVALVGGWSRADTLPTRGDLACVDGRPAPCVYIDRTIGLHFEPPLDWPMRRLRITTEADPRAGLRAGGAVRTIEVDYVPEDDANPEAMLFRALVYELPVWYELSARATSMPGYEVASSRTHAVVVTLAAPNPYPPESRDALIFDALEPAPEELSIMLTFVGR
jgi:hypothetical protein